jgi:hypothetical protein
VPPSSVTQLQRQELARRLRWAGPVVLLAILLGNLALISYAFLHGGSVSQKRVLIALFVLVGIAAFLLGRISRALTRRSSGTGFGGNVGPSNNRWRGP